MRIYKSLVLAIAGLLTLTLATVGNASPGPDLLVGSRETNSILRYNGTTGAFVGTFVEPGSGGLNFPTGMVLGPDGNLYVSSAFSDQVLRYDGDSGAFIDAFVATGSGGLDFPTGVAFGPDGNLYVSSRLTDQILRYDGTTGAFIDAFVPTGSGGLASPTIGLVFRPDGKLYVIAAGAATRFFATTGPPGAFLDVFVAADNATSSCS